MNSPAKIHSEIRRDVRQTLNGLSPTVKRQLTDQALENFIQTPAFGHCQHIGLFYPVRHELDILPLLDICWSKNKKVYLPCLMKKPFQKLYFLPFDANDDLKMNRFAIPEPDHPMRKKIALTKLDLVVTPLLAFSEDGHRLGMGGGYYDRTFAYQLKPGGSTRPRLWAIALEAQQRDFPVNPWDVPIDGVSTELNNYHYSST